MENMVLSNCGAMSIIENIPNEESLFDLSELYKLFGDATRLKILFVLSKAEMCVCDIADALNMNVSAVSHQLSLLKRNKLVKYRRDGKQMYYSIADDHVRTIIGEGMEHIGE